MRKKGDISMNMIILAILGLIALVILIFIFREQVGNASGKYFGFIDQAEKESQGEICQTMFGGRKCLESCAEPYKQPLPGEWSDCKKLGEGNSKTFQCCASPGNY